jgi:hypothetical protein
MRKRLHPCLILAGVLCTLLSLTGSASAATELHIASGVQKVTLPPAGVRQLVNGGVRVQVSTQEVGVHPADVRLFVYQRALNRGGQAPGKAHIPASWKTFVSPLAHLRFTKAGTQYVTLHVDPVYRTSLLRAGSLILGIRANGY